MKRPRLSPGSARSQSSSVLCDMVLPRRVASHYRHGRPEELARLTPHIRLTPRGGDELCLFLPESPLWYEGKGRVDEAHDMLAEIARCNNVNLKEEGDEEELLLSGHDEEEEKMQSEPPGEQSLFAEFETNPLLYRATLATAGALLGLNYGAYGNNTWVFTFLHRGTHTRHVAQLAYVLSIVARVMVIYAVSRIINRTSKGMFWSTTLTVARRVVD